MFIDTIFFVFMFTAATCILIKPFLSSFSIYQASVILD
jgi:hypothetical protein